MLHDLSPTIFHITDGLAVHWYGLSYVLGFTLSYILIAWMASRQRLELKPSMVGDLVAYGAIGVILGGRIGYCLFYSPELFLMFKSEFPFWGVFALNEGGMSSHGGMIGLFLATTIYAYQKNIGRLYLYDLIALAGSLAIFFGRVANFINGELIGRVAPAAFPYAVKFPTEIYLWLSRNPERLNDLTPLIEKLGQMPKSQWFAALETFRTSTESKKIVTSQLRFIIEGWQNQSLPDLDFWRNQFENLLSPRYPSQLIAAFSEGLILFLILFFFWRRPRKSGLVSALFLTLYSIARIGDEFFREPDVHLGYQFLDLTRGQWLSVGSLVIGLLLLFIISRESSLASPGWSRGQHVKIHRR